MLLVDATSNNKSRFEAVEQALPDFLYGDETSLFINRKVGNGVMTYTEGRLREISDLAKYHFPVTTIRLGYWPEASEVVDIARQHGGIVIIDDAELLDSIEGLADALRALESPYIKFVYVALVHDEDAPLNRFSHVSVEA